MNIPKSFLNEEGKKYARYIFLSHNFLAKIPGIGKYAMSVLVSTIYAQVLKEGAIEHQRRKIIYARNKAKVSGVRYGDSSNRQSTTGEVREMRLHPEGIRGFQQVVGSVDEVPKEGEKII